MTEHDDIRLELSRQHRWMSTGELAAVFGIARDDLEPILATLADRGEIARVTRPDKTGHLWGLSGVRYTRLNDESTQRRINP